MLICLFSFKQRKNHQPTGKGAEREKDIDRIGIAVHQEGTSAHIAKLNKTQQLINCLCFRERSRSRERSRRRSKSRSRERERKSRDKKKSHKKDKDDSD